MKALSEPARALLEDLGQSPSRMAALSAYLSRDCAEIQAKIEALVLYGTGFRIHCTRTDGSVYEVLGQARGGSAHLSVSSSKHSKNSPSAPMASVSERTCS